MYVKGKDYTVQVHRLAVSVLFAYAMGYVFS